jgi:hypothetical protein
VVLEIGGRGFAVEPRAHSKLEWKRGPVAKREGARKTRKFLLGPAQKRKAEIKQSPSFLLRAEGEIGSRKACGGRGG